MKIINERYDSDPRIIWRNKTELQSVKELKLLSGIGNHKVSQFMISLYVLGEVSDISEHHMKYISVNCTNFINNIEEDLRYIRNIENE